MPFQDRITNCSWLITRTLPYVLLVKRSKLYTIMCISLEKLETNSRDFKSGAERILINEKKNRKTEKLEIGFFSVGNHKTLISRIKSRFIYQDLPFSFRFRFYSVNPARVWIFYVNNVLNKNDSCPRISTAPRSSRV